MEELLRALYEPTSLTHYRATMLASDGRVLVSGELLAADDADALAQARELAKENAVDVWDGLRFVGLVDAPKQECVDARRPRFGDLSEAIRAS